MSNSSLRLGQAVPAKPVVPPPAAKPAVASVPDSIADRLKALERGDLTLAVKQGEQHIKELPAGHWTLRLEVACQGDTLREVTHGFRGGRPDLFVLPIKWRDGRSCYQVLYGQFPTRDAAEHQMKRLPATFLANGNRPKAFRLSDIPKLQ